MLKHALVMAALLLPGAFANAHEYSVGDLHIAHSSRRLRLFFLPLAGF